MKNNNACIYVYAIFYAHKSRRGGGAALKIMIDFIIVLGQISIVVGGGQHKRLISKHNTHTCAQVCLPYTSPFQRLFQLHSVPHWRGKISA